MTNKTHEGKKEISNCCGAEVTTISYNEGTCYYECHKCKKHCDIRLQETNLLQEQLKKFDEKYLGVMLYSKNGDGKDQNVSTQIKSFLQSCQQEILDEVENIAEDVLIDAPLPHEKGTKRAGWFGAISAFQEEIKKLQ